jgi:SAM-dependent methyltransferase
MEEPGPRPRVGDAFGGLLRAALAAQTGVGPRPTAAGRRPRPVVEIVERDDGFISGNGAITYLDPPELWRQCERRALARMAGRVLDVGAGAGRVALALQDRGVPVTALDVSPGAVDVCRARGVRDTVCGTIEDHLGDGRRYDTFVLFGNNIGLLGSRERAPDFLTALAALAHPGARLVAQGTDPYTTRDPVHVRYRERNRARGRMGGQQRVRIRHLDEATPWFDYLLCSVEELASLAAATPWRVSGVDDDEAPVYVATLVLRSSAGPERVGFRDPRH